MAARPWQIMGLARFLGFGCSPTPLHSPCYNCAPGLHISLRKRILLSSLSIAVPISCLVNSYLLYLLISIQVIAATWYTCNHLNNGWIRLCPLFLLGAIHTCFEGSAFTWESRWKEKKLILKVLANGRKRSDTNDSRKIYAALVPQISLGFSSFIA